MYVCMYVCIYIYIYIYIYIIMLDAASLWRCMGQAQADKPTYVGATQRDLTPRNHI